MGTFKLAQRLTMHIYIYSQALRTRTYTHTHTLLTTVVCKGVQILKS